MSITAESVVPGRTVDPRVLKRQGPFLTGKSKALFRVDEKTCLVELIPSLSSFTFNRHEVMPGTEVLRLDFYERVAELLARNGVETVFRTRISPTMYLADWAPAPPFETIVKNFAVGSTMRKYPGLFTEGSLLRPPVVKFDYRIDPEDQPIADDYLRNYGCDVSVLKEIALRVNLLLSEWLQPRVLVDFCLIFSTRPTGVPVIISEISPDCMRLRSPNGESLDKDLFRQGASQETILKSWRELVDSLPK